MRTPIAVVTAIVVIVSSGCGDGSATRTPTEPPLTLATAVTSLAASSTPMPSPTVTTGILGASPFVVRGPMDAATAVDTPPLQLHRPLVLNVETGRVYAVELDWGVLAAAIRADSPVPGGTSGPTSWSGPDRLALSLNEQQYVVALTGETISGPTSISPADAGRRFGGTSADGQWGAGILGSGAGGVVVGPAQLPIQTHISAAERPDWADSGHRLAFIGNLCADYDLFVFDPETNELRNLTGQLPPTPDFVWNPGGSALAVLVARDGVSEIGLIDVATGVFRSLLAVATTGSLRLGEWSPDGRHLLFTADPVPWTPCTSERSGYPTRIDTDFGGP